MGKNLTVGADVPAALYHARRSRTTAVDPTTEVVATESPLSSVSAVLSTSLRSDAVTFSYKA